ncbi:MAG: hypothetical protein AAFS07_19355 [Pseudomonadota bacterium]
MENELEERLERELAEKDAQHAAESARMAETLRKKEAHFAAELAKVADAGGAGRQDLERALEEERRKHRQVCGRMGGTVEVVVSGWWTTGGGLAGRPRGGWSSS